MALVKGVVRKRRKKGNPTLTPAGFVGSSPQAGHEERLASYIKRTLQLHAKGHPYYQIGEMIAEEFSLETIPHIATVAKWRQQGLDAVKIDIAELQMQLRIDQFNQLEAMKQKWLPIATTDTLAIQRWVRVEGELQPELDENALKDQIEATKQVVAIMNRQARLLGLDLEKSVADNGEGPGTLQELQIWLINQVNVSPEGQQGKTIDAHVEKLELKSGLDEIDNR